MFQAYFKGGLKKYFKGGGGYLNLFEPFSQGCTSSKAFSITYKVGPPRGTFPGHSNNEVKHLYKTKKNEKSLAFSGIRTHHIMIIIYRGVCYTAELQPLPYSLAIPFKWLKTVTCKGLIVVPLSAAHHALTFAARVLELDNREQGEDWKIGDLN